MAQTIALNIVLNGVPQAVNNIEELELKLKQAKIELSQIAIGSDAFKKLASEIQIAESQLKNLQKSSEGKDLEGKLGDFARLGGAIGASFGAATAALSLFGEESEDSTKALAQAQNALVIALAAREAAEGAVVIKTIANDISTKALAASTAATNAVTKQFYATLAANPYTAILTVIGLVVAAFMSLSNETAEATKKQKEFQKNLDTDITKEVTNLNVLVATVNDTTQSLKTRETALDNLQKKFPGYFKDLKQEDILTGKVKIATDKLTASIVAQAQARALEGRVAERSVELLDLERELARATRERTQAAKDLKEAQGALVTGGGTAGGFGGATQFQANAENNLAEAVDKVNKLQSRKNAINKENKRDINDILRLQKSYVDIVTDDTEETDKNTDAKEKNIQATRAQIKLYSQLEKALNDQKVSIEQTIAVFQKLADAEAFDIADPKVLEDIKQLKSAIDGLIPDNLQAKFKEIGLEIQLVNNEFKITKNTLEGATDTFGEFTETIRKTLSTGVLTQGIVEFGETTMDVLDQASEMFQKGLITKEAFESTEKLIKQYKDLNFIIRALPEGVQDVFTGERLTEYLNVTKQIAIATGDIKFERDVNGQIVEITNSTIKLSDELTKLETFTKDTTASLIKLYEASLTTVNIDGVKEITEKNYNDVIDKLVRTKQLTEEQGLNLKDKFVEFQGDATKLIQELAKQQAAALNQTVQNIVAEENQIRGFLFQVQQQRTEALKVQGDAQARVFLNNLELVYDFTQKENKIIVDSAKTTEQQREQILKDFALKNIDLTKLTQEEIDKIIQFYLGKQKEALDKSTEDRLKRVSEFQDIIQEFQAVLNSLSQTTSLYFDSQFDQLEKRYQRVQEGIIGDSEAANQKRIEAEKAYQAERIKLEKQAAKQALRISLAQSLANTAEAITKAFAAYGGTPASFIAASFIAGLSAVQTGIIANQLATIDSYRKGGRLKPRQMAGGGMVFGPSHEMGGVKFQGGGIELEGNESVINRVSTLNYMGLLDQINQAGGGRPIGPGYDDSRIIEAIAKQRNTPIRAYVVESDITAKQETARRLEKLSQI